LTLPTAEETLVEVMRSRLEICGVKDGNYIEVYPNYDKKGKLAVAAPGDRWFMKVVDGRVVGKTPKLSLKACVWCSTNSLNLDPKLKEMVAVEIGTILDEGPPNNFKIVGSNGRVLPKVVKATPVVIPAAAKLPTAAKVPNPVIAVDSDSEDCSNPHLLMKDRVRRWRNGVWRCTDPRCYMFQCDACAQESIVTLKAMKQTPAATSAVPQAAAASTKRKAAEATVHLSCTGTPKNDPYCICEFCLTPPPSKKPTSK
jgi:hypothetical protein